MLQQPQYLTNHISLQFGEHVHLGGYVSYDQPRNLLYFITDEDSEVLSVNLEAYGLTTPTGRVWIKDWSEHAGVTAQLISLGAVLYEATARVGPFDSPAHLVNVLAPQAKACS